jgi:AhpC/TSA family
VSESPEPQGEQSPGGPAPPSHRLDPDRAAATGAGGVPKLPPPVIDTRRYRWMIGVFGITLVIVISVYQFVSHGVGTIGVPAGQRLHFFAAPLADSTLNGAANLNPTCSPARHDPRALNTCLVLEHTPLVLAFFVVGSNQCEREVDTLQTLSGQFPAGKVQFAAVAVAASHSQTAAAVRRHHWTIPVAYDEDGRVGSFYGVETCPLLELARPGGVVADRLIGDHWITPSALAQRVRALL